MSEFYPTCLEGIDVTTQGPKDYYSNSQFRKEVGRKLSDIHSANLEDHSQTQRYLSAGEKNISNPDVSVVIGGDSISYSNKGDQPLDLSVRKRSSTKRTLSPDQFLSLSSSVPTIFSNNPGNIFKIPVPPELGQTPSSNKYTRLNKAVNQTFEFSYQNPFIGSKPSIFQRKYNLCTGPKQSSTSKQSHTVPKALSKGKRFTSQLHRYYHQSKSIRMEPQSSQKQPEMFDNLPQYIKEEPMETVAFSQSNTQTNSAGTFNWHASYSPVTPKDGLEDTQNATYEAVKNCQEQQAFSFPDSSTDYKQATYFDLSRPYPLTSEENKSAFKEAVGMGLKEDIVKQDKTIDSSQKSLLSPVHLNKAKDVSLCQVCGDQAAGFYCGAYICEACKKFFIRASKLKQMKYVCLKQRNCKITKESRVHCQYCRFQKCLSLNMLYHKDGQKGEDKSNVQEIPCRVCSAPSSGFHFGALTCEGCKGFFRRMVNEREPGTYTCGKGGKCEVNSMTRNMCKACRYAKCLMIGMCVEGSRIGRQPNAVKHAISLEVKKQAAQRENSNERNENQSQYPPNSFKAHVPDTCVAESPGTGANNDWGSFYHTSDNQNQKFVVSGKEKPKFGDYGWRDNKERDSMVSSSTESLDMIARADESSDSFQFSENYGFSKTDFFSPNSHFINDAHGKSHSVSKDNVYASSGIGVSNKDYQICPQISQVARQNVHQSLDTQQPNVFLNKFQQNYIPGHVYRSKSIPSKSNLIPSAPLPNNNSHHERRYSEDLELINFNLSMHGADDGSQLERGRSIHRRQRVLGIAVSGSLPSSWSSSQQNNMNSFNSAAISPMSQHSGPYNLTEDLHLSSNTVSWEQNKNLNKNTPQDHSAFKNQFISNSINTYCVPEFTGSGGKNSEFQSFTRVKGSEEGAISFSGNSIQQTHYPPGGAQGIEGNIQMDKHLSSKDWHTSQQRGGAYPHYTYQKQKAFIYDTKGSRHHKPLTVRSNTHSDSFVTPQQADKPDRFNDKKRKQSQERYDPCNFEVKDPDESPTNAKNRYEPLEWNNSMNNVNNEVGEGGRSFRAPGQIRSPSLRHTGDGCRGEVERSRSSSPHAHRWQTEHSSGKNSLKHRHESQGSFNPSPYHRRPQSHESGRIPNGSNRSRSLDRFVPSFSSTGGHGIKPGSTSTLPPANIDTKPQQNLLESYQAPDVAKPNVTQTSDSVVNQDQDNSVSEAATSKQPHPTPSTADHTNSSFDKEMQMCANVLGGICLVEEAKKDYYPTERLDSGINSWNFMMDYFHFHAIILVRFAKKVPGFRDFKLDDQVKLLRSASYNLVLLNHTREYEPETGFYNYFNIPKKIHSKLLEFFPEFNILHTHCKHCGILAKKLNITETEYGYMSSMLLLDEECEGLEESNCVRQLKEVVMAAFQQYELDNFPNGSLRFGQMLLRLSEFSQFAMQHNMAVRQIIIKHPDLPVPQLYAEMYDTRS